NAALLERALPPDIAGAVERMHRAKGVDVRLGARVSALVPAAGRRAVAAVALADGTELPADLVVIGIGIIPNTELAEMAGAASADGVVTDEFGRSSVPGVWAAGDVTSHWNPLLERRVRLESWQNAQNQAIAVANNIAGKASPYAEVPWFWSDQHGVNIQMAGLASPGTRTVWRGDPAKGRALAFSLSGARLVCATGFDAGADIRLARRLIESRAPVSDAALADPARKLKDLAVERAAA
ncbi:MAG: NAD(FAD)-dependent dehydrogenase, partial [Alphaproteobacteria bacterium]|nr:NAD(FAD)-dependent dehydrogenase [Alphaproteobacteria bacterium]